MRVCKKNLPVFADYAWRGRVVVFDTETTGGTRDDEICQLAAAEYRNGTLSRTINLYLRPTCEMNSWAEAIHGLSMDFLEANGIDPVKALNEFFDFLGRDVLLVAHNNLFDMTMLRLECGKFGVPLNLDGVETCDTLALSRHLRPELAHHSLAFLIEALKVGRYC